MDTAKYSKDIVDEFLSDRNSTHIMVCSEEIDQNVPYFILWYVKHDFSRKSCIDLINFLHKKGYLILAYDLFHSVKKWLDRDITYIESNITTSLEHQINLMNIFKRVNMSKSLIEKYEDEIPQHMYCKFISLPTIFHSIILVIWLVKTKPKIYFSLYREAITFCENNKPVKSDTENAEPVIETKVKDTEPVIETKVKDTEPVIEKKNVESRLECSICMDNTISVVLGCGHTFCSVCPSGFNNSCPTCRAPYTNVITLYF